MVPNRGLTDYAHDIDDLKRLIVSFVLKDQNVVDLELYKINKTEREFEDDHYVEECLDPEATIGEVFASDCPRPQCVHILVRTNVRQY